MTVADRWRVSDRAPNATFIRDVDAKGLFDLLTRRIGDPGPPAAASGLFGSALVPPAGWLRCLRR